MSGQEATLVLRKKRTGGNRKYILGKIEKNL